MLIVALYTQVHTAYPVYNTKKAGFDQYAWLSLRRWPTGIWHKVAGRYVDMDDGGRVNL
jgi:hypothetical protein